MKLDDLIQEMQGMVNNAKAVPFAGDKAMLSRGDLLDILDEIEDAMPSEIRQAKNIVADRNQILTQAKKESEEVIKKAEERRKALINQSEIVRQAQAQAQEILNDAKIKATGVRKAANQYVDDVMKKTEEALATQFNDIKRTRQGIIDAQNKAQQSK